jgi:hypothetical protein
LILYFIVLIFKLINLHNSAANVQQQEGKGKGKGKSKAIPLPVSKGPVDSRRLSLPDFKTVGT